jgi:hypothetical protein
VVTVARWEFFSRVLPGVVFADGSRDSARLCGLSGAVCWLAWSAARMSRASQHALQVAVAADPGPSAVGSFVAATGATADRGLLSWDGSAVLRTDPARLAWP